jgi:hypothetical protein
MSNSTYANNDPEGIELDVNDPEGTRLGLTPAEWDSFSPKPATTVTGVEQTKPYQRAEEHSAQDDQQDDDVHLKHKSVDRRFSKIHPPVFKMSASSEDDDKTEVRREDQQTETPQGRGTDPESQAHWTSKSDSDEREEKAAQGEATKRPAHHEMAEAPATASRTVRDTVDTKNDNETTKIEPEHTNDRAPETHRKEGSEAQKQAHMGPTRHQSGSQKQNEEKHHLGVESDHESDCEEQAKTTERTQLRGRNPKGRTHHPEENASEANSDSETSDSSDERKEKKKLKKAKRSKRKGKGNKKKNPDTSDTDDHSDDSSSQEEYKNKKKKKKTKSTKQKRRTRKRNSSSSTSQSETSTSTDSDDDHDDSSGDEDAEVDWGDVIDLIGNTGDLNEAIGKTLMGEEAESKHTSASEIASSILKWKTHEKDFVQVQKNNVLTTQQARHYLDKKQEAGTSPNKELRSAARSKGAIVNIAMKKALNWGKQHGLKVSSSVALVIDGINKKDENCEPFEEKVDTGTEYFMRTKKSDWAKYLRATSIGEVKKIRQTSLKNEPGAAYLHQDHRDCEQAWAILGMGITNILSYTTDKNYKWEQTYANWLTVGRTVTVGLTTITGKFPRQKPNEDTDDLINRMTKKGELNRIAMKLAKMDGDSPTGNAITGNLVTAAKDENVREMKDKIKEDVTRKKSVGTITLQKVIKMLRNAEAKLGTRLFGEHENSNSREKPRGGKSQGRDRRSKDDSGPRRLSAEQISAITNYAKEKKKAWKEVTLEEVQESPEGVKGWADKTTADKPDAKEKSKGADEKKDPDTKKEKRDTSTIKCIFFKKGTCRAGDECKFMHTEGTENVHHQRKESTSDDDEGWDQDDESDENVFMHHIEEDEGSTSQDESSDEQDEQAEGEHNWDDQTGTDTSVTDPESSENTDNDSHDEDQWWIQKSNIQQSHRPRQACNDEIDHDRPEDDYSNQEVSDSDDEYYKAVEDQDLTDAEIKSEDSEYDLETDLNRTDNHYKMINQRHETTTKVPMRQQTITEQLGQLCERKLSETNTTQAVDLNHGMNPNHRHYRHDTSVDFETLFETLYNAPVDDDPQEYNEDNTTWGTSESRSKQGRDYTQKETAIMEQAKPSMKDATAWSEIHSMRTAMQTLRQQRVPQNANKRYCQNKLMCNGEASIESWMTACAACNVNLVEWAQERTETRIKKTTLDRLRTHAMEQPRKQKCECLNCRNRPEIRIVIQGNAIELCKGCTTHKEGPLGCRCTCNGCRDSRQHTHEDIQQEMQNLRLEEDECDPGIDMKEAPTQQKQPHTKANTRKSRKRLIQALQQCGYTLGSYTNDFDIPKEQREHRARVIQEWNDKSRKVTITNTLGIREANWEQKSEDSQYDSSDQSEVTEQNTHANRKRAAQNLHMALIMSEATVDRRAQDKQVQQMGAATNLHEALTKSEQDFR